MAPKNRARSHPPKSYPAIPAIIGCQWTSAQIELQENDGREE